MLKEIRFAILFLIVLSFDASGQRRIIREEFLKITPYVSTLEDVAKAYGEEINVIKGRDDYLSMTYKINENREVSINYFRDCNQTEKPEKERTWIVEEVFFSFDEKLKIKPKEIFSKVKDFTDCPYGDVAGQMIYFNKDKNIQFTFMRGLKAVTDLSITATEENKAKYRCRKKDVEFTLDPKGFRCNIPD